MPGRSHTIAKLTALLCLGSAGSLLAATGEIRVRTGNEPAAACLASPNSIGVSIQVASLSDAVNGAQARISYNTSLLTLNIGSSTAAPGWTIVALTDASGLVTCAAINNGGSVGPGAGPFTVANLVFSATAAQGSSSIAFQPDDGLFVTKLTTAGNDPTTISGANLTKSPSGLIVVNSPTATASSNSPVCSGATLSLTGGPNGMSGYSWSGPNSFSSIMQSPSISNVTPAAAGTYTLTVTDSNGCQKTAQTTVTINTSPTATASSNSPLCAGGTLNLLGGPGGMTSYSWTGPNSFTSIAQNPTITNATGAASGTYTLTVTDSNGCQGTAQTSVTINPNPTATASSNSPVCAGGTLNLLGGPGGMTGYSWTGPNSFASSDRNPSIPAVTGAASGTYTLTVTDSNGCQGTAQTSVTINSNPTATASSNSPVCTGGTLNLIGGPGGMTSYSWTGPNSFTSISQSPSISNVSAAAAGTYTLTVTDSNGCQGSAQTSVSTVAAATANAGPDQSSCGAAAVTLAGSATNAAGVAWSGGTGSFNPSNTTLNPQYTPSPAEVTAGTVTLTLTATGNSPCGNAVDSMTITIVGAPTANAGPDQSSCGAAAVTLAGSATNAASVAWSGGTGTFNPNNTTLNAQYTPSAAEVTAGTVTLTLTATGNSPCGNAADSMTITIVAVATANAGPDQSSCGAAAVTLAGSATNAASVAWSGGAGSFNPNNTTLNAQYTPSAAEVTAGTVTLTLTATGNSPCGNAVDSMTITIVAAATSNAGPDQSSCGAAAVTLAGSATNAAGVAWSGGAGSFNPNNTTLNAQYTPSAAEVTAGTVTLTLTATGNSPCGNAVDSMTITIQGVPTVNAGTDQSVCAGNSVTLAGSASNATGVAWSGGAGTFNPNNTTLNAQYTPSPAEVTAGTVTLTLSGNAISPCSGSASDQLTITITTTASANAGPDQSICAGSTVQLAGTASNPAGASWSGGSGTFNPDNTTLNAVYTPSPAEVVAGTVTLTLTVSAVSPCTGSASDQMTVTIIAAPTANAGSDQSSCGAAAVTLAGSATNAASVAWSGGTGTFNPNNTTLNAQYTPSAAEVTAGTVTLTLTATGNSPCGNAVDSMTITIVAAAAANAGPDQSSCGAAAVTLAGSATNAASVAWSGGTGTFNPNNTTLNAQYTPSAAEVTAGTVTLTLTATGNSPCGNAADSMTITIVAAATANAGPDQSSCGAAAVTLAGSATNAASVAWSGGAGTFNPNNTTLNAQYTPSAAEVTAGTVTLTLTATGNSPCGNAADSTTITIVAAATANAGPDQSSCGGAAVTLAGSATHMSGVTWSGGAGTFNPNNTTLNAQYTPSAAEVTAGTVTLTLTATGNPPCGNAVDSMTITIQGVPTVNAGTDQSVCAGNPVTLAGSASNATGVAWSGGTGTFNPNNTTLNAQYTPSPTEVTAGTVTLTLSGNAISPCSGSASDSMTITIVAAPTAEAGSNQTICGGGSVTLAGSTTNAVSASWSGGSGTFVPNASALNAQYTPSAAEIAAGTVTLTLTATGNSPCGTAVDTMTITIQACLTVNIDIPGLIGSASEGGHVADRSVEFVLTACPATTETRNQTVSFTRTGSSGTAQIQLTNINPTTSWLSVREAHTLRKLAAVDLSGDANDTVSVSLKSGDFQTSSINQDGVVDIVDFSILASRWNTVVSDCGSGDPEDCSLGADANGDGIQNTVDFTAIQINYFQTSDAQDNCPPPLHDKPGGTRPTGPSRPISVSGGVTQRGRSSVPVLELSAFVSRVGRADLTGDGVVDARDVRAFARANGLVLRPEFEAKLGPIATDRPAAGN